MWINNLLGRLDYEIGGKAASIDFETANGLVQGEACVVRVELSQQGAAAVLSISADFQQEARILGLVCRARYVFSGGDTVFLNGYQSWTDSREFDSQTRLRPPSRLLKPLLAKHRLNRYGDYDFVQYPAKLGQFHGYSYGYIRTANQTFRLLGSLDERSGFTVIKADMFAASLSVEKDLAGLPLVRSASLLKLYIAEGTYDHVFDGYFAALAVEPPKVAPATGWTSWYNYYQNISEDIILGNLKSFASRSIPIDIFQIDDGFQTAVGDWLSIQPKFPNGMAVVAKAIREAGYTPGLWLAPFVCETKSKLFAEHQDWIVRDAQGQLVDAGGNWSGFYCLNLELPAVRDYLRLVFRTVLDDWGFQLVKLDFLYAACIQPHSGKTRGQLMCEAMDFLRELVGDRKILGCGVPLWPSFGKVDYCRIGTDVDLQWDNGLHRLVAHRERPSTVNSIENAIGRRHLDRRAFVNDPDVFLLRHDNIKLNKTQQHTLFAINALFGNLLFTSDDLEKYRPAEYAQYLGLFPFLPKVIETVDCVRHFYKASFSIGQGRYRLFANCSAEKRYLKSPENLFCLRGGKPLWLPAGAPVTMEAFESLVCRLDSPEQACWPLGSTSALFPASEVAECRLLGDGKAAPADLQLTWHQSILKDGELYVRVPAGIPEVHYEGKVLKSVRIPLHGLDAMMITIPITARRPV